MVEGLRPVRRDGFPDVLGGTAPGERGRRLGFGCPRWQLRRQGGRGGPGQPRGRGQCWAVPAGVSGADPSADPDPAAGRWRRWSLGSRGRPCRPSVATWSATICVTPARCTGCSRSSLACCSGCIWARGSPCTRQRSMLWPPGGSGREACCNHHRPTPTHPPQRLTLPTNSNPDPEEATRADVTAPPTSTPTRRTQTPLPVAGPSKTSASNLGRWPIADVAGPGRGSGMLVRSGGLCWGRLGAGVGQGDR
jgi:hypothetical protein